MTETTDNDLLQGAKAIADFIGLTQRQVFHLAEIGELPVFKIGGRLTARKSTLLAHIEALEAQALAGKTARKA